MPILFDYRCRKCSHTFEALVDNREPELPCPICTEPAVRLFSWRGGFVGQSKGKFPYFDIQLGTTVDSAQHRDRIAKERGLEIMGNEEWERSRNAPRTPDPLDSDEPDPQLIEIAKRAWDDVKFDRVPPEVEEDRVMDIVKESDFLDASKAKIN